ncbi:MAG TPA: cyclase family protein [Candidatus Saccharimonadales bacterium]|nr:cyclase family protein [Candidatus Saccharimonadales bacterium]
MKLIDLSVILNQQTPVYPGDPAVKIEPVGVIERDGWNDHLVSLNTHAGTHIDAPLHMIADGKTLDQIPIEQFAGRGRLVAVTGEFSLNELQNANIQEDDIVLFCTGMSEKYHEPIYFESYPVMSEEIAYYLVERKVKMIGVDAGSVDNVDGFPIHKILLAGGVLVIENLTNLNQLTDKNFIVYALPIKLDIDGAPARVIAETT